MYESEVDSFCERVTKRAVTKRQEFEAEEKAERVKKSPGGLDHEEVFHSLPDVCFYEIMNVFDLSKREIF